MVLVGEVELHSQCRRENQDRDSVRELEVEQLPEEVTFEQRPKASDVTMRPRQEKKQHVPFAEARMSLVVPCHLRTQNSNGQWEQQARWAGTGPDSHGYLCQAAFFLLEFIFVSRALGV